MVLATAVYVTHPDIALVPTVRSIPDAEVGVVTDAGTDPQHDVHCFWVEAADFDAFEAAVEADPTIASFSRVAGSDDRCTYHIEYSDRATLVTPVVSRAGGLVLGSRSYLEGWRLDLQLPGREALYELDIFAEREGLRLDILELREAECDGPDPAFDLTEPQIEALVGAYLQGYYDEPREATLDDLASLLDISRTAVSGRLHRGSAALIEEALVDEAEQ